MKLSSLDFFKTVKVTCLYILDFTFNLFLNKFNLLYTANGLNPGLISRVGEVWSSVNVITNGAS